MPVRSSTSCVMATHSHSYRRPSSRRDRNDFLSLYGLSNILWSRAAYCLREDASETRAEMRKMDGTGIAGILQCLGSSSLDSSQSNNRQPTASEKVRRQHEMLLIITAGCAHEVGLLCVFYAHFAHVLRTELTRRC